MANKIKIDPSRTLIVLEGGIMDGQWFYADDFEANHTEFPFYKPTKRTRQHPSAKGPENQPVTGSVWVRNS